MPNKIKDLERKIEALIIAIPKELEAYRYYMELSGEYSDEASVEMFKFLAAQEMEHKNSLERLLNNLEKELEELRK